MSEHGQELDASLNPETGLEFEHETDPRLEPERGDLGDDSSVEATHDSASDNDPGLEHTAKKKKRGARFASRGLAGVTKSKRETRFGVAALLSFVILVTVLLINKQRVKGKVDPRDGARGDRRLASMLEVPPPPTASDGDSNSKSKSKSKAQPDPDSKLEMPSEPARKGSAEDGSRVGDLAGSDVAPLGQNSGLTQVPSEDLPAPLPDDKLREVANESVPLPAPVVPAGPTVGGSGGSSPVEPNHETGTELPLPAPSEAALATTDLPAGVPAAGSPPSGAEMPPGPGMTPTEPAAGGEMPPLPGGVAASDPGTVVEPPAPASDPGLAGSGEAPNPTFPPTDTEMKSDLTVPGGTMAASAPADQGLGQPVESPQAQPVEAPQAQPVESPQAQPVEAPQAQPVESPQQTPELASEPPQTQLQTSTTPPAAAQTPAAASAGADRPAPAVVPGELPNFDRAPSGDDSAFTAVAPPQIKPGEGIPIANAGKGRGLDGDPLVNIATSGAATAGTAAVAVAATGTPGDGESTERVAPELHVVQRNENFWTISQLYYSSGRYYKALWKANSRTVPAADQLMVGQTIVIPPPEALDRNWIEPPRLGSGRTPASGSAPTSTPARGATTPVRRTSRSQQDVPGEAATSTPVRRSSEVELNLPIENSVLERRSRSRDEEEALDPPLEKRHQASRPRYKVRAGQTLRGIARDTLNDVYRADEIYELNHDLLGNDPRRRLVEGQILELPEDAIIGRRSR